MKFKKIIAALLVVVFTVSVFTACGGKKESDSTSTDVSQTGDSQSGKSKTVVVISDGESGGFWDNVQKGASEAAQKHGYTVVFRGTQNITEKEAKKELVSTVADEKPAGIVLSANGDGFTEVLAKTYDNGVPVIQFENGIDEKDLRQLEKENKNPVRGAVFTAEKEAGDIAAQRLFNAVKGDIEKTDGKYQVAVISQNETNQTALRSNGFYEKFTELADADEKTKDKYEISIKTLGSDSDSLEKELVDKANCVFITTEDFAATVSDTVSREKDKYKDIVFCGFDSGAKQIEWLKTENSNFIGAVARNGYEIGYNAVEQCVFAAEGKATKEITEISAQWYDVSDYEKMLQSGTVYN